MENTPEKQLKNLLIVEDDTFMSGLLERKFSKDEYKIFVAPDTKQAEEVLGREKIDLMILDVILPGTDGITFLGQVRERPELKTLPIIVASNLGQPEEIERGMQAGATGYIVKANTTPGEIVKKVEEILAGGQAAPITN